MREKLDEIRRQAGEARRECARDSLDPTPVIPRSEGPSFVELALLCGRGIESCT